MYISKTIQQFSSKIYKARTGVEAIEKCRKNPDLDLVLMDIGMPEMDGLEATRQIKKFNENVIIIAQTAFGFTKDRKNALEAGCNDYISKPFSQNSLKKLIMKHFI
jgi:CheY-like chemotaxis protein